MTHSYLTCIVALGLLASSGLVGCAGDRSNSSGSPTASAPVSSSDTASASTASSHTIMTSSSVVTSEQTASSAPASGSTLMNLSAEQLAQSVICPAEPALPIFEGTMVLTPPSNELIRTALAGNGLSGSVHGVARKDGKYVISLAPYRSNEFSSYRMSVYSEDPQILEQFAGLRRGVWVTLQGELTPTASVQPHIKVTQLITTGTPDADGSEYDHAFDDSIFEGMTTARLLGTVHAIMGDGEGIVMNFEDMILPIMVDETWQPVAVNLWRADRIEVDVSIQNVPGRPTHFYTRTGAEDAIKLVDKISNCHGNTVTLEGDLLRLDSQNFLGVKAIDPNGVSLVFLILPGTAGADAAKAAWGDYAFNPETDTPGRNHFYRNNIKVRVTGSARILAPGVAHAQLSVPNAEDFEIISQD